MLVMITAHIVATIALTRQNRAARQAYEYKATIQASKSSRTMILSGLTILAFVIYHMLHFTVRVGNEYNILDALQDFMLDGKEVHNAWKMVIDGFSVWYVSALLRHRHDPALLPPDARRRLDFPNPRPPLQKVRRASSSRSPSATACSSGSASFPSRSPS